MNTIADQVQLSERAQTLLKSHQEQIYRRTDRMFAILMPIQWLAAIGGALWFSSQTWSGAQSSVHPHVWMAVVFGGTLCSLPVALACLRPGAPITRYTIAVAQVLFSSLFIQISGGRIETHFHVFGSLAFLAAYRDWKLLIPPTLIVAADHFVRGVWWPETVFGVVTESPWRWLEHTGWVLFEDLFLIICIRQSVSEMQVAAKQTAELERSHAQLEKSKNSAEAASAAKSAFLANMSHEIRTPLSSILGFSELLRRGVHSQEERKHYLDTISSSGQHLLTLINDILDLSKIEAGRMECEFIRCSPHDIFSSVLSILRVPAREKGLTLDCKWITPAPETIVTDPARLRQLLMNLTANAIKFTESGSIQIRAAVYPDRAEPRLYCEIEDTGIGIESTNLERIFFPFDQADNSITRKYGGTGLGLAICRHIAKELGGEVTVKSNPGRGSVFYVRVNSGPLDGIPLMKYAFSEAIESAPRQDWTRSPKYTLPGSRILLVDDGEANRQLISLVLTEAGATVTCASNGQEAVELASQESFELILMDMQMPVMDGYTATRTLRSQGLEVPILALTAHAMRGEQERCLAAGCTGYLSKPVQIDRLVEAVAVATQFVAPQQRATPAAESDASIGAPIRSTLTVELTKFAQIVESFVVGLAEKLDEMQNSLDRQEWTRLADLAHWLKGSGGTVGFDCLTEPAGDLERAAQGKDDAAARQSLKALRLLAKRMETACV